MPASSSHTRWNGCSRPCPPHLSQVNSDGIKPLTLSAQGELPVEETREAIGDKILLNAATAVLFWAKLCLREVQTCVRGLIEPYVPNLLLGIGHEVPAATDAGAVPRPE